MSDKPIVWEERYDATIGSVFYLGHVRSLHTNTHSYHTVAEITYDVEAFNWVWVLHGCGGRTAGGTAGTVSDAKCIAEYAWGLVGVDP